MTRSPARHRRPCSGLAARRTCLVHGQAQAWAMEGPGCPDTTTPVPGLCRPGRCRPSPVCSSFLPGVLRGEPQRSSTPHPLAPCGGDASTILSDGPAGSEARMRPHRPQPAPEVSPMQPVATAPRGDRSQSTLRVPTRGGVAPVSSLLLLRLLRDIARPDGRTSDRTVRVWLPAPFVARGCSRAGPDRSPCMARHPQATGDQEGHALPRPLPDVAADPRRSPQPATSRPPVQWLHPLPTPASAERPHTAGLPRKVRKGRARLHRLQPLRRAPPRSPKRERTVGGEGSQRGSCCRVPVDVLGRGSRERPSPGRLACVAGRSRRRIPRWAGAGRSEDRP